MGSCPAASAARKLKAFQGLGPRACMRSRALKPDPLEVCLASCKL